MIFPRSAGPNKRDQWLVAFVVIIVFSTGIVDVHLVPNSFFPAGKKLSYIYFVLLL